MRVLPPNNRQILGVISLFVAWFLLMVFFVGCTFVRIVPHGLPIPEAPPLEFVAAGPVCLNEQDANALHRYLLKLEAFREAWDRLGVVK